MREVCVRMRPNDLHLLYGYADLLLIIAPMRLPWRLRGSSDDVDTAVKR
jgi:hypothetical protein